MEETTWPSETAAPRDYVKEERGDGHRWCRHGRRMVSDLHDITTSGRDRKFF